MLNRRILMFSLVGLPLVNIPTGEIVVERGIKFLGPYPKYAYYSKTYFVETLGWTNGLRGEWIWYTNPSWGFEPAPILAYYNTIKQQKKLGYNDWILI